MEVYKLDLRNLRGQGYDGASVMSVLKSGVSARIKELQPRAEYHHCRAHALNLVISSSCRSVDIIRTVFDDINQLTWFLGGSPKRTAILKRHLPDAKQVDYLVGDTDDEKVESNINISNVFSMIDERKESIYPIITRYGIFGKCSVNPICHSSDCSWFRQLDTDAVGDRSCLHPYAYVEDCVRPLSGNDFLTILSINESLVHIAF
jgi:hypothetical protein